MGNRIKVLHLISGTGIGGSEILALNLARHHSPESLDLHIIATGDGALVSEFQRSNASFSIIKRNLFLDPFLVFRLYFYCRSNNIEVIHCHQILECLNANIVKGLLRIKLFLTYHGYYYFEKNIIVRRIGIFLAGKVSCNIFVSRVLKDYYIGKYNLGSIRSEVIYNGTPVPVINPTDKDSLRNEFGLDKSKIIIGMTGNFAPARNQILLCKVFRDLVNRHPYSERLHLIFIGGMDKDPSPKYREAFNFCLESGMLDKVHFAGPRFNASNLLGNYDIFVYSTHRETFCLAVAEAILSGIPVLVNDLPVMKEITGDGILAELYETDNQEEMFRKLSDSLMRLEMIRQAAKEKQEMAIGKYSIQKHLERLINLYSSSQ